MLRMTGMNFRATVYLGVTLLALAAAALILTARKLRGGTRYSDAFFPMVLLHWGHFHTFWSGFQVAFAVSCCLAVVLLMMIVRDPLPPSLRASVTAGTCLVALPLCGAQGLLLVPPLVLWLGGSSIARWLAARRERAGSQPRWSEYAAIPGLVLAAVSCLVIVFYLRGYPARRMPGDSDG